MSRTGSPSALAVISAALLLAAAGSARAASTADTATGATRSGIYARCLARQTPNRVFDQAVGTTPEKFCQQDVALRVEEDGIMKLRLTNWHAEEARFLNKASGSTPSAQAARLRSQKFYPMLDYGTYRSKQSHATIKLMAYGEMLYLKDGRSVLRRYQEEGGYLLLRSNGAPPSSAYDRYTIWPHDCFVNEKIGSTYCRVKASAAENTR